MTLDGQFHCGVSAAGPLPAVLELTPYPYVHERVPPGGACPSLVVQHCVIYLSKEYKHVNQLVVSYFVWELQSGPSFFPVSKAKIHITSSSLEFLDKIIQLGFKCMNLNILETELLDYLLRFCSYQNF